MAAKIENTANGGMTEKDVIKGSECNVGDVETTEDNNNRMPVVEKLANTKNLVRTPKYGIGGANSPAANKAGFRNDSKKGNVKRTYNKEPQSYGVSLSPLNPDEVLSPSFLKNLKAVEDCSSKMYIHKEEKGNNLTLEIDIETEESKDKLIDALSDKVKDNAAETGETPKIWSSNKINGLDFVAHEVCTLFVNNVPQSTTGKVLKAFFPDAETVILPLEDSGQATGYALLTFKTKKMADRIFRNTQVIIEDSILTLHRLVLKSLDKSGKRRPDNTPSTCYLCQKTGHRANDCYEDPAKRTPEKSDLSCVVCKKSGHRAKDCPVTPAKREQDRTDISCFVCKKSGHRAKDCPVTPEKLSPRKSSQNGKKKPSMKTEAKHDDSTSRIGSRKREHNPSWEKEDFSPRGRRSPQSHHSPVRERSRSTQRSGHEDHPRPRRQDHERSSDRYNEGPADIIEIRRRDNARLDDRYNQGPADIIEIRRRDNARLDDRYNQGPADIVEIRRRDNARLDDRYDPGPADIVALQKEEVQLEMMAMRADMEKDLRADLGMHREPQKHRRRAGVDMQDLRVGMGMRREPPPKQRHRANEDIEGDLRAKIGMHWEHHEPERQRYWPDNYRGDNMRREQQPDRRRPYDEHEQRMHDFNWEQGRPPSRGGRR